MAFATAFQTVIMVEGGYANHPDDPGGQTKYGITLDVARANGYGGDMRELTLEQARRIYKRAYWDRLRLDEVGVFSDAVADRLFDIGVNCGIGQAAKWLQRSLNAFNKKGTVYPDIAVDGGIGPATLAALRQYLAHRGTDGETVLLRALNSFLGHHYLTLTERGDHFESFVYGWLLRRVR